MHYTDSTFTLDRKEIVALCAHASTDEMRPHLNGVGFDTSQGRAVATDGHRLAVLEHDASDRCAPEDRKPTVTIVPLDTMQRAIKAMPRGGTMRVTVTNPDNGTATIVTVTKEGAEAATIQSTSIAVFPPYSQIIPPAKAPDEFTLPTRVGFNAHYLASLALVQAAAGDKGVDLQTAENALSPMRVTCGRWLVVIMPMRLAHETHVRRISDVPAVAPVAAPEPVAAPAKRARTARPTLRIVPPAVDAPASVQYEPAPSTAGREDGFTIRFEGSFAVIVPLTDCAHSWLTSNAEHQPYQWQGAALTIDRRYAEELMAGAERDGHAILRIAS